MAFVSSDLDKLERAIADGVLRVAFADGRRVEYNTVADLMRARDMVRTEIAMTAASPPQRTSRVVFVRE